MLTTTPPTTRPRVRVMCQDPLLSEELAALHPLAVRTTAETLDMPATDALIVLTGTPATRAGRHGNERGTAIYLSTDHEDPGLWDRAMYLRVSAVFVGTSAASLRLLAEQFTAHLGSAA
jgi:hypothetical protein